MNNKFNIFITKNLYLLLVSIYSIDASKKDKTDVRHKQTTKTIFYYIANKMKSINPYENNYDSTITLIFTIGHILTDQQLHNQANDILKDILHIHKQAFSCSQKTHKYIKKFTYNYRKDLQPYLLGHQLYKSKSSLTYFSIIGLVMIQKIYNQNNIFYLFLYLVNKL